MPDITGNVRIGFRGEREENIRRFRPVQGWISPGTITPADRSVEMEILADLETFINEPTQQQPFDIETFLRDLPAVLPQDVPAPPEDICIICVVKHHSVNPDTFLTERPCRLPCGHVVGRACIAKWLRPHPKGSNSNTCPFCRQKLFETQPPAPLSRLPVPLPVVGAAHDDPFELQRDAYIRGAVRDENWVVRTRLPEEHRAETEAIMLNTLREGEWIGLRDARFQAVVGQWPDNINNHRVRFFDTRPQVEVPRANLLGMRPVRNLDDERHERRNAIIEQFHRQQHIAATHWQLPLDGPMAGPVPSPVIHPTQNISLMAMRDPNMAFHLRIAVHNGFFVLSGMEPPHTNREHEALMGQRAANRRQMSLRERDLYIWLNAHGAGLPQAAHPMDELLSQHQDDALFEWLQGHSAFRNVMLNEAYRIEQSGPRAGRVRNNRAIYEMLRECAVYWEMRDDFNGRWRTRQRHLFDEEEDDLPDIFQELLREGALDEPNIRRLFPGSDHYQIFRTVLEMGATWNSGARRWERRSTNTGETAWIE